MNNPEWEISIKYMINPDIIKKISYEYLFWIIYYDNEY